MKVLLSFLFALALHAQNFTVQQPNCQIFVHFTALNQTAPTSPNAGLDNRTTACTTWNMAISVSGFASATVALQSAPDNAGVPGTWVTYANSTIISASPHNNNPIVTATEDFVWIVGYQPWVRVKLTAVTGSGTVNGGAFGCNIPSAGASPTASQNVVIVGPLGQAVMASSIPVVIASNQSAVPVDGPVAAGVAASGNPVQNGGVDPTGKAQANLVDSGGGQYSYLGCDSSAEVALSGTGYTSIVSGVSLQSIHVCKLFVTSASGGNPTVNTFTIGFGTCAGTPTEKVNAAGVTGLDMDFGGSLRSAAADALCVKESVGQSDKVTVTYSQRVF